MNKINVGDEFLITREAHFEKAKIIKKEKGIYHLDNQVKMDANLNALNSKVNIAPFDQEEYNYLLASSQIPKLLHNISRRYKKLPKDKVRMIYTRLNKIIEKCGES